MRTQTMIKSVLTFFPKKLDSMKQKRCHDTKHNYTKNNDTQHNCTKNNDTQHNCTKNSDTQHNNL